MDGNDQYEVRSQFEDLHSEPADAPDLEVDLNEDNPIVKAYLDGDDDNAEWTPPKDDADPGREDDVDDEVELEDDEPENQDDLRFNQDGDEEDDEDEYSNKVQKRIAREKRLREDAEDRARSLEARQQKLEERLNVRESEDELKRLESDHDGKLAELRKKKREAIDEGNVDDQIDIDEKILDIKAELQSKRTEVENKRKQRKDLDDNADTGAPSKIPERGRSWLKKHPEFHTNSKFREAVLSADRLVSSLGYDNTSPEYYAEIEDHLKGAFPEYFGPRNGRGDQVEVTKRRKSAVGGEGTGAGQRRGKTRRRSGRVRLTKTDQENMRRFGLDPANAKHVKEFAANKGD